MAQFGNASVAECTTASDKRKEFLTHKEKWEENHLLDDSNVSKNFFLRYFRFLRHFHSNKGGLRISPQELEMFAKEFFKKEDYRILDECSSPVEFYEAYENIIIRIRLEFGKFSKREGSVIYGRIEEVRRRVEEIHF